MYQFVRPPYLVEPQYIEGQAEEKWIFWRGIDRERGLRSLFRGIRAANEKYDSLRMNDSLPPAVASINYIP